METLKMSLALLKMQLNFLIERNSYRMINTHEHTFVMFGILSEIARVSERIKQELEKTENQEFQLEPIGVM